MRTQGCPPARAAVTVLTIVAFALPAPAALASEGHDGGRACGARPTTR